MKPRIELDWSRMLGFDQVEETQRAVGDALTAKAGSKPMAEAAIAGRMGAKAGSKPGQKSRRSFGHARIAPKISVKSTIESPGSDLAERLPSRLGGKAGSKSV